MEAIDGLILRETPKAYRLRIEHTTEDVWMPKSLMKNVTVKTVRPDSYDAAYTETYFSAEVPAWKARELPFRRNDGTPIPYATKPW